MTDSDLSMSIQDERVRKARGSRPAGGTRPVWVKDACIRHALVLDESRRGASAVFLIHAPHEHRAAPDVAVRTRSRMGDSARHGPHHAAQKLTTTTLPRNWPNSKGAPDTVDPVSVGAAVR